MSKVYKTCNPALQEKVRALVNDQTGTMTQAALAKEIGYSGASISTYISDKFENDVEKFEARLINYFEFKQKQESLEARVSSLCPVDARAYVPLSISENIYQAIEYCRLVGGISVLHGSAGVGKTMAIQKYKRDNLGFVVHFRASERLKTPKQVAAAIADKVGVRNCRNEKEVYARTREVIDGTKKVIIIDEAHRLPQRTLEDLRDYCDVNEDTDKPGIGIVLVGNTRVMNFISTIKSDEMDQFRNRMTFEGKYHTSQVKLEDIQTLFPLLAQKNMEQELNLLWTISQNIWGLRGAVNVYNSAVNKGDITYKGLLNVPESTRIGIV